MASFPPQLPAFFLDRYPDAREVLDPFCGRGTTLLEATLKGRVAHGCDLLPTARALSKVKLRCAPREAVLEEIDSLDLSGPAPCVPTEGPDLAAFYHPETYRQLWHLRESMPGAALTALALGRMHGHSPGFFSAKTFNVISVSPESLRKSQKKHGTKPEPRDVKAILRKAAERFIPELPHNGRGSVMAADARCIPLADGLIDLVITSPPFLDVVDYEQVNWLRDWFIGNQPISMAGGAPMVTRNLGEYTTFLGEVLEELRRVLAPTGTIVFEVGQIGGKHALVDLVEDAAWRAGLAVVEVLENDFAAAGGTSTPKISRAMRDGDGPERGAETTTMNNVCVVLRPHGRT
jgi:SAM-dependent methyltransferase